MCTTSFDLSHYSIIPILQAGKLGFKEIKSHALVTEVWMEELGFKSRPVGF